MPDMKETMKEAGKYAKQLEQSRAKANVKKPKKPAKKETLVQKVARKLMEIYYQPKTKFTPTGKKGTKGKLRKSLSTKEIKRLG